MTGGMKMLGRVFILRRIAATHVPADQTQAQMHPLVSGLETLLATRHAGRYLLNLIEMRALRGHGDSLHSLRLNSLLRIKW